VLIDVYVGAVPAGHETGHDTGGQTVETGGTVGADTQVHRMQDPSIMVDTIIPAGQTMLHVLAPKVGQRVVASVLAVVVGTLHEHMGHLVVGSIW